MRNDAMYVSSMLRGLQMRLPVATIVALGMAFAAATGSAAANEKVVFLTDWLAEAEHGGFYQALAEGLYKAEGLDVTIKQGGPQVNTAQLLLSGAVDMAIEANSFVPLNAVKENAGYVAVAAFFQKDPQVLMSHPESGFKTLADLKGKPILISNDAWETYWKFLKVKYGFDDKQGRPYTFSLAPWLADKTLTQQGYVTSEPFSARAAGVDPIVFLLADYGYTTYSQVLMVSRKMIAEKPQVVQGFIDASIKGWNDFLNGDHSKGAALIIKDNPDYTLKTNDESIGALKENGILTSGDAKTLGIGAMTDARWKDFFDTLVQAGVYPASLDYKQAYTLQFVNKKVGVQ
jgi:NitT/TauT family transport system substrate-binding protein